MFLLVALLIVGFLLYQAWNQDHPRAVKEATTKTSLQQTSSSGEGMVLPAAVSSAKAASKANTQSTTTAALPKSASASDLITVKTDVLTLQIDLRGGSIVSAILNQFPQDLEHPQDAVVLFNDSPQYEYLAQSLLMREGETQVKELPLFEANAKTYELKPGESDLTVVLKRTTKEGVEIQKQFNFRANDYLVNVTYNIHNGSGNPFNGRLYQQLLRAGTPLTKGRAMGVSAYFGAALSTESNPYQKIPFKNFEKSTLDIQSQGGWVAMQQHYFLSAWIPSQEDTNQYYTRKLGDNLYAIGVMGPLISIAPGQAQQVSSSLYVGPVTSRGALNQIAPHLGSTMDYGWFWFLSEPILWIMQQIEKVVGNWGIAIILVTLLIKIVFYKFSATSYRSMANMRKLQPKLQALKERFGDD